MNSAVTQASGIYAACAKSVKPAVIDSHGARAAGDGVRDADALAGRWAHRRDAHELVAFVFGHHYVSGECNCQRTCNQKACVGDAPAAEPPMRVNNLSAPVVL